MKKGSLSSLIFASSLFFNSIANASEFSDSYPNLTVINKAVLAQHFYPYIWFNQGIIDSVNRHSQDKNTPEKMQKFNQNWAKDSQQENACLVNFDKTQMFANIENQITAKVSASELSQMENFLSQSVGQKIIDSYRKMLGLMLQGDMKGLEAYNKQLDKEITKADEQVFEAYEAQHKKSLKIIGDILESKAISDQAEIFANSCVSKE